jgi:GTP cyclohydrolase I
MTEDAYAADIFIDDIIDSGATKKRYEEKHPCIPFYAIVNKKEEGLLGTWVSFPWEEMTEENGPVENIRRLLEYIGENPDREGLKETPNRVIRSYDTLYGGYKQKPKDVMKVFEEGACDEMVLLKNIHFSSTCEHHMLPFTGRASIAYIPDGKVIGVSKLARILEIYARRLQIQERIGSQVTDCLMKYLKPKGAACVLEATHGCMVCRGVQKQDSVMVTSSLTGIFLDYPQTRSELFALIQK